MLEAIADGREFRVGYHLLVHGKLNRIIDALGGPQSAAIYFQMVATAEPPEYTREENTP